jgi:hypothetical protein
MSEEERIEPEAKKINRCDFQRSLLTILDRVRQYF